MFEWLRFIITMLLTLGSLFFFLTGVLGLFRFRYAMNRIHAAALGDTVGILLLVLGLTVAESVNVTTLKMFLTVTLLWLSSPVASHLIAGLILTVEPNPGQYMSVECPDAIAQLKEVH